LKGVAVAEAEAEASAPAMLALEVVVRLGTYLKESFL
jgi:hypothetical protein